MPTLYDPSFRYFGVVPKQVNHRAFVHRNMSGSFMAEIPEYTWRLDGMPLRCRGNAQVSGAA